MLAINAPGVLSTVGAAQSQRIGDKIQGLGWTVRMLIGQKGDHPNVTFRMVCASVPKGTSLVGTGLPYNNFFENVTGNVLLDDTQKETCRILKSAMWRPNQAGLAATGNDEYTKWF